MASLTTDALAVPNGAVGDIVADKQAMKSVPVTVDAAGALTAAGAVTGSELATAGTIMQNDMQFFTGSKVVVDGSATGFVEIAVGVGELVGGNIVYCIHVIDGTDFQSHTGGIGFVAVNKAGTVTSDCGETYLPAAEIEITTAGTLTDTVTCTNGAGKVTLNMNANTTIAGATITLHYTVEMHSQNVITGL